MKRVLVVCSTVRMVDATREAISRVMAAGATYVQQSGSSDVTIARNLALTAACRTLRDKPELDVVLLVDDDMVFTTQDVVTITEHVRASKHAASGAYVNLRGQLTVNLYKPELGLWLAGLGFLAVHRELLLDVERMSHEINYSGTRFFAFTESCAIRDPGTGLYHWSSEDLTLCRRFGGVELLPIAVGHVKPVPMYPDAESIAKIANHDLRALTAAE